MMAFPIQFPGGLDWPFYNRVAPSGGDSGHSRRSVVSNQMADEICTKQKRAWDRIHSAESRPAYKSPLERAVEQLSARVADLEKTVAKLTWGMR
jgi:hypothetical protein